MPYETVGGLPDRGATYGALMDNLRQAQEHCAMLAHLNNTEGNNRSKLIARGWLAVAEMLRKMQFKITELAQGRIIQ